VKKYFRALLYVCLLLSILIGPESVLEVEAKPGADVIVSPNVKIHPTGKHIEINGEYYAEYEAEIDSAPNYVWEDGEYKPIQVSWFWDSKESVFYSGRNLFNATVSKGEVTVWYEGEYMKWNPVIQIGSATHELNQQPQVLNIDPINEHYGFNTLKWNFGVCDRYLRIIEGMLIEYWIVDKDPHGDIIIKSNVEYSKGFDYEVEPYAYDADGVHIPISGDGGDKLIKYEDLKDVTYPITIDPSSTYYTGSADGYVYVENATYNTAHNAASGTVIGSGGQFVGQDLGYWIFRSGLYFDTSGLPDNCTISAAVLSLYGY